MSVETACLSFKSPIVAWCSPIFVGDTSIFADDFHPWQIKQR